MRGISVLLVCPTVKRQAVRRHDVTHRISFPMTHTQLVVQARPEVRLVLGRSPTFRHRPLPESFTFCVSVLSISSTVRWQVTVQYVPETVLIVSANC